MQDGLLAEISRTPGELTITRSVRFSFTVMNHASDDNLVCVYRVESRFISFFLNYCLSFGASRPFEYYQDEVRFLAGEVEHSVLEEAVGYTCYSGMSWLQESSSYLMPENIAQSFSAGAGQLPNGLATKGGHWEYAVLFFSKTGS